jgi:2-keto-4-pentenoate hydratase/2-oxohepta-3-ene-1,7-dioic acid hydratase in catechol pathway
MIHSVAALIVELSKGMTLEAGDVIATGTPKGVGMGFHPPKFLQQGDKVEIVIENIGSLVNEAK